MYRPAKYQKDDPEFIYDFIKNHPFANFILNGENLLATHIPILLEGDVNDWKLYSHIANHNEQRKYLQNEAEALIIFQGADAYVSSSWYKEKDISTWDYSAVHVNAKIKLQTSKELERSLQKLVKKFEKKQENPLFYKDIPQTMLDEHLSQITGFWLEPYKIQGIAKLHQSYSEHDVRAVVNKLKNSENSNEKELSEAIRKENKID